MDLTDCFSPKEEQESPLLGLLPQVQRIDDLGLVLDTAHGRMYRFA